MTLKRLLLLLLCVLFTSLWSAPRIAIVDGFIQPTSFLSDDHSTIKRYTTGKLPVISEGVHIYTAHFNYDSTIQEPSLYFGAMYYPCIVSINGHDLYQWGKLKAHGGMVNYSAQTIRIPRTILTEKHNILTIRFWTDGLNMGLPKLWIGETEAVRYDVEIKNAYNATVPKIGVSLAFIVFGISMLSYFLMKTRPAVLLYFGFYTLTTALTFHMFLFNGSTLDHVIQTKIFRTATPLMALAMFYLISYLTKRFNSMRAQRIKVVLFLIHVPLIIFIWSADSKFVIEQVVSKFLPIGLGPLLIGSLVLTILAVKESRLKSNWVLLLNVVFILLSTKNDLSSLGRKVLPEIWMLPYSYILMTFSVAGMLIYRQVELFLENKRNKLELQSLYFTLQHANTQIEHSREVAVQESFARESFLKTIAHELRTPLTGLLGGVNAIADDETIPVHLKKPVFYMKSSFHRLFVTVSNLFDFVEIKKGTIAIVAHPFRVVDVLEPVLEYYRDAARAKGISLIIIPPKNIPEELYGDSEHLLQIIDNLLGNSLKFTNAGGISCELSYANNHLTVAIKDTGVGIEEDRQAAMFKAFSRGEEFSFSQRYEGVGLGLSIVDAVVKAMKGTITFSSVPGKGTVFIIVIPIITANKRTVEFSSRKKVLIVEDNAINALMVTKQLESGKFITEAAVNGKEAVDMCKNNQYDAILMDIQMPIMDGIVASKEIRKFNVKTPIIALTANGDRIQCMRAGMNEVLMKPISSDKLISVVSNMIQYAEKGL